MDDFEEQKRQAEQRVLEMNRRYRQKAGMPPVPDFVELPHKPQTLSTPTPSSRKGPTDLLRILKLDSLKTDPDRLLLLGLFLLLSGEETDEWLLYALLYIML